jgi:hypothetical protein
LGIGWVAQLAVQSEIVVGLIVGVVVAIILIALYVGITGRRGTGTRAH